MRIFRGLVSGLSARMSVVAGASLVFIMLLTVLDVTLRYFGHPVTGVYDLVALGGAVVIGFSIPFAAQRRVHVFMEMAQILLEGRAVKIVLSIFARIISLVMSLLLGWNLVKLGMGYRLTGEASLTIQIPYYPIALGLAVCFFIQAVVFIVQIYQAFAEENHG